MTRTYLMNIENVKTVCQGALGAMTFGAYHQFTSNKMMELNNTIQEQKMEKQQEKMEKQQEKMEKQQLKMDEIETEIRELKEYVNKKH